jgi:hypothetical protein
MKGLRLAVAAAAVCGLLVLAPSTAAKSFLYEGPVDQPEVDPFMNSPRIEFKVRFSKNKKGKRVPKSVKTLDVWNVWYQCEHPVPGSGSTNTIFWPGAINDTTSRVIVELEFPVKHRRFHTSQDDYGSGAQITVSGELKGGKASGDVRLSYLSEPGDDFNVGACGTGTLSWTASRGF